jgi:hypothetical protein
MPEGLQHEDRTRPDGDEGEQRSHGRDHHRQASAIQEFMPH